MFSIIPQNIQFFEAGSASEFHLSVSPLDISNDELVTVTFQTDSPNNQDWIGAYSPGGIASPVVIATTLPEVVQFKDVNEPLRNRVTPSGDPNTFTFSWSSASSALPTLRWGYTAHNYLFSASALTSTINKADLCGAPSNTLGWHDLGLIHRAQLDGIVEHELGGKVIHYSFGDLATETWSTDFRFQVPPLKGTQPANRPTTVVLLADLGEGSTGTSSATMVWSEVGTPSINTTMSIGHLVSRGDIDAVFLSGDISYADGHLATWDFNMDMISAFAGGTLLMITLGNHESDFPGTAALNYNNAANSGGECGVITTELIPLPNPATRDTPWWSYDIGIIHFVAMSTEHDYTFNSPQYLWLESDLIAINRSLTPWVIFSGHRSMYVDSTDCCKGQSDPDLCGPPVAESCTPGSDVGVMRALQQYVEPLLHRYRVNLAFAGHYHDTERQSAIYQNKVVQRAEIIDDGQGGKIAYHDDPNATVWYVIGTAGKCCDLPLRFYDWSEEAFSTKNGYAIVTAVNTTHLDWVWVNSLNNEVLDHMIITQSKFWVNSNTGSSESGNPTAASKVPLTIVDICAVLSLMLIAVTAMLYRYRKYLNKACSVCSTRKNENKSDYLHDPLVKV